MKAKDLAELAVILWEESYNKSIEEVAEYTEELIRLSARMQRRNENACNVELTPQQDRNNDRDRERVEEIVRALDLSGVVFNADPRGYPILLVLPSRRTNDWGQRGWGIDG